MSPGWSHDQSEYRDPAGTTAPIARSAVMSEVGHRDPVYSISVTSELSGVDPQALRLYEQRGLLNPFRTQGGTRRYSHADLDRISAITALLDEGLNLAGIAKVLLLRETSKRLTAELVELQEGNEPTHIEIRRLRQENRTLRTKLAEQDRSSKEAPEQPRTAHPSPNLERT
jgi:DNA-binding transcriptional MerR regulator